MRIFDVTIQLPVHHSYHVVMSRTLYCDHPVTSASQLSCCHE